jgi:hypothetical protein
VVDAGAADCELGGALLPVEDLGPGVDHLQGPGHQPRLRALRVPQPPGQDVLLEHSLIDLPLLCHPGPKLPSIHFLFPNKFHLLPQDLELATVCLCSLLVLELLGGRL